LHAKYPEYAELLGRAPKTKEKMEKEKITEDARRWYISYLGVQPDVVASLPITFTENEVIFRFPGIDKVKIRTKGERGAIWRGTGHTPDLWPLPPERVGEDIVITEGESDCIVARALGLEAYAITKGAATGLSTSVLIALRRRGARRIVVAMDADSAGRQAASKMVIAARQAGLAAIDLDLVAEGLIEPLYGHKDIRDAYKHGRGQDIVEAVRHLLYRADESRPLQPRKLSEIMNEDTPTDFIIEGLLRAGGTTILIGEPKLGKSQMSLDLALAVSRGEAFAGLATKKGRVIYYALEDGEDIVRDRVKSRGLLGMDEDLYIGTTAPVVEDSTALLEEHIDIFQPSMVIIDTLRAMSVSTGKSENEASFADSIYRIAKVARERGVAAIIVHHTVKATTGNPITDARGTSAIAGAVDVVAGLYRRDDVMKLAWRGRFGSGELTLSQHPNGSFSYFPSVPPPNTNPAEHNARVEERLNQYYQACLKHAGKDGRINVRQVVISMWGLKDGKFRDGSWDKTYKALDELVKRQKLRKRERQYYIVPVENNEPPKPSPEPEPQIDNKMEEAIQQNMPDTEVETNNNVNEDAVTLTNGEDTNENNVSEEPLVQRFMSVLQGKVINNSSSDNNQNKTDKPMNTEKKRSLLREAKQVMDATFVGGGELAVKTRELIRTAYTCMASNNLTEAAQKLKEAYELVKAEKDRVDDDDHDKAVYALDLGFFIYAFAVADDKLRKIAWDIWDARDEFRNWLYDAIKTAERVLSMTNDGLDKEAAINELVVDEELARLKEILLRHNA
jgi:5S rRNA maturation endonuclease (ribonuclease M5)